MSEKVKGNKSCGTFESKPVTFDELNKRLRLYSRSKCLMVESGRASAYRESEKGICKELAKNIKSKGDFDSDICSESAEAYKKLYEELIKPDPQWRGFYFM